MSRKPVLDEGVERDDATMDDLTDAFKMLLKDAPAPKSKNRRPTNEELNRRYRLERR